MMDQNELRAMSAANEEIARLRAVNAELLAALKRAEQYLELTLMEETAQDPYSNDFWLTSEDCANARLIADATASRNVGDDLDVIRAAIAKAEGADR